MDAEDSDGRVGIRGIASDDGIFQNVKTNIATPRPASCGDGDLDGSSRL